MTRQHYYPIQIMKNLSVEEYQDLRECLIISSLDVAERIRTRREDSEELNPEVLAQNSWLVLVKPTQDLDRFADFGRWLENYVRGKHLVHRLQLNSQMYFLFGGKQDNIF